MAAMLAAVERIRDRIEQAGIRAVIDPRDISPPCVWVTVDQLRDTFLHGDPEVDVRVTAIVPDNGHRVALANLSDLVDQLLASGIVFDQPIEPEAVTLPSGGSALPAMKHVTTV